MIAQAIWPLVIAIVGALMYALAANPKLQDLGRVVFFCGFFFLTAVLSTGVVHLTR